MFLMRNIAFCIAAAFSSLVANAQSVNPSNECFSNLDLSPELQVLKGKVALGGLSGQTLEMLSNDKRPTPAEKVALAKWDGLRQPCIKLNTEWNESRLAPNVTVIIDKVAGQFKESLADLYSGKITYGQFAKIRQANSDKAKVEIANIDQQNKNTSFQQRQQQQQLEQQAAQQEAQDRQANNALATQMLLNNKPYQAPMPYQMPPVQQVRPPASTNTNCRMIGNTLNCTSY
jgi:hypothetical protein